jgi:hypothetical protein
MNLISQLSKDVYWKLLNTEDALAAGNYPASGSYIDVSGFSSFGFFLFGGALDSALTLTVYQDTSATQTADIKVITSATETFAGDDDDKWCAIEVETAKLDSNSDFRYVTLTVAGATGSNDYGAIVFFGIPAVKPPTQPTTGGPITGAPVLVNG